MEECAKANNILFIAITRLGDLLQASPTIVGMKAENPTAKLTVLVDRSFAKICHGIPGVDEVYEVDIGFLVRCMEREGTGIIDAYQYVDRVVADLRSREFDYCLNISSSGYTAVLLKLLNVKNSRGWISDDQGFRLINNPWSLLFAAFVYHANRDYNSLNLVDIVRCLAGVKTHPQNLVYNVPAEAQDYPDRLLRGLNWAETGPLICVQAGASQEKRQWPPERFAKLGKLLVETLNARVVYTGTKGELPIIDAILRNYQHPQVTSVAGMTDLGQLAALLQRADLLITGDTGPMHLAVAVGTPVVALFLASALCFETGPYSAGNLVIQPLISCSPCNPNFPCARPDCHDQFSPELVAYLAKMRLETPIGQEQSIHIPGELAAPEKVAIYCSVFDSDQFLDFVRVNGDGGKRLSELDKTRRAYRQLWKEEFHVTERREVQAPGRLPVVGSLSEGLSRAIALTAEGKAAIDRLVAVIHDQSRPPAELGIINREIEKINRDIEELGLSFPALGALTRVFVLENNNMRGEDPLLLASEMREQYQVLEKRSKTFGSLLQQFD